MLDPISHSIIIKANRGKVFNAISNTKHQKEWFLKGSFSELRKGHLIKLTWEGWEDGPMIDTSTCPILEMDEGKKLIFQWWSDTPTQVSFHFSAQSGNCLLRLEEYGYPNSKRSIQRCIANACAWGEALVYLKKYLEE